MPSVSSSHRVRVELLGPLRLLVDGEPVEVPGPKRRAVLAHLALAEGRTVSVSGLGDAVRSGATDGGDRSRAAVQNHVSRLRKHLGPAAANLQTTPIGYRLDAGLDLADARRLRDEAAVLPTEQAYQALRQALDLWRGPALADVDDGTDLAVAREAATRLQASISDALITTGVLCERVAEVVDQAHAAVAADPLREGAVLALMRALAASGHGAEALRAAHDFRHRLVEATGLDATPELANLERATAAGALAPAAPSPTLPAPPWPRPTTPTIGRLSEISAVATMLGRDRLVSIVGPGGVGKTRLALEVAAAIGEAFVVPLASVSKGDAIPHAIATALGLSVDRGPVLDACLGLLAGRSAVVVVDNCEHVVDEAAAVLHRLLSAGDVDLRLLATSREPLGLAAERVFRLAPLPTGGEGLDSPAVTLFADRARRVGAATITPDQRPAAAEIVRRLDGLPLAIELAAGRLSTLSLDDLRDRLDRALDVVGGRAPTHEARHRTLRAMLDWSAQLLTEPERQLLYHLSVFPDGVDLPTAEWVAADLGGSGDPVPLLARLVDASMIERDGAHPDRYRMLATVRMFGVDQLVMEGRGREAEDRLLRWAAALATRFGEDAVTAVEADADGRLRREWANLRAAWQVAIDRWRDGGDREALDAAVEIVLGLFDAIAYRDLVEARRWAMTLADDPATQTHPHGAAVLAAAAEAAYHDGDLDVAERLADRSLALAPPGGDTDLARIALASVALARGELAVAVDRALAATGARAGECRGVAALALAYGGEHERARAVNHDAYAGAESCTRRAWKAYIDAEIDHLAGDHARAMGSYLEATELSRRSGATFVEGVATVGLLSVGRGRPAADALAGYRDVIDGFARTGNWPHLAVAMENLAGLLRSLGDEATADGLDAAVDAALVDDAPPGAEYRSRPSRDEALRLARGAIARHLDLRR